MIDNEYLDSIGPDLARDLKLIQQTLRSETPNATLGDAATWAIQSHAHCLRADVVVASKELLNAMMGNYAAVVLSEHFGTRVVAVPLGIGKGFEFHNTGETVEAPTTH